MTTKSYSRSPLSGIKGRDGLGTPKDEVMGVLGALETVCELESRLRLAIKSTHPLDSTNWDFDQADRERNALLNLGYVVDARFAVCVEPAVRVRLPLGASILNSHTCS